MNRIANIAFLLFCLSAGQSAACPCDPKLVGQHLSEAGGECRRSAIDCALSPTPPRQHSRYERQLIRFLQQNPTDDKAASTAVWILGTLKSEKAIPCLIDHFEMDYVGNVKHLAEFEANPSTALIMVGTPSLLPLLKSTTRYTAPQTRQLIGNLYVRICGSKAQALAYLQAHTPKRLHAEAQDIAYWINQVKE